MQPSFALTEKFALGGSEYTWRLKDSEIRFRGAGRFKDLVLRRFPVSDSRIASFFAALDLIEVWEWRDDYHPQDDDCAVLDGSEWSFTATLGERTCRCGGVNAYPSFADAKRTTTDPERFALLHAALYSCFGIDAFIEEASRHSEREQRDEPTS